MANLKNARYYRCVSVRQQGREKHIAYDVGIQACRCEHLLICDFP